MSERLYVYYQQQLVGLLSLTSDGRMEFKYHFDWIQAAQGFPISLSLPLDGSFTASAGHFFFANLLPEANVRQQICKSLGISADNDFQLLKAIGGDCAGALVITTSSAPELPPTTPQYQAVTEEQLANWSVGTPDAYSAVVGQSKVRLSLAGAQDKLPVHIDGDKILIPLGNTPSTHILKFASPYYTHLPENETFISMLAGRVGLPVADVSLRPTSKARVALIARYDRVFNEGQFRRLHQEDFCQALGIKSSSKYEKEGGPNLKQCADLIRRYASFPLVDLQKLLQWSLFNLLVGNADAHGKNLSLLYDAESLSLAPFYDLLCTRNYKNISRDLAMRLGGIFDPDLVGKEQLQGLATDFNFRSNVVIPEAKSLIDNILIQLPETASAFADRFGDSPVLERIPILVRKQIRRVKTQLSRGL